MLCLLSPKRLFVAQASACVVLTLANSEKHTG